MMENIQEREFLFPNQACSVAYCTEEVDDGITPWAVSANVSDWNPLLGEEGRS